MTNTKTIGSATTETRGAEQDRLSLTNEQVAALREAAEPKAALTAQDKAKLDCLAAEAETYAMSARMNLFQLSRVFAEARKILPHGEWGKWVQEHAGVEMRTAQQMIQSYERFGGMPALAGVDRSKLYKLTALPEGTEEAFMARHDVNEMSSREVEKAVKAFKAELQGELDRERDRRERAEKAATDALTRAAVAADQAKAAEDRAREAENRPPVIPDAFMHELQAVKDASEKKDGEINYLTDTANAYKQKADELARQNARLRREADENAELLAEQQQEIDRVQNELLSFQSAQARGDAERTPADELTADVFAGAVRQFVGICARMPYMSRTFGSMNAEDLQQYDELLKSVEGWCRGARKALDSVEGVGSID